MEEQDARDPERRQPWQILAPRGTGPGLATIWPVAETSRSSAERRRLRAMPPAVRCRASGRLNVTPKPPSSASIASASRGVAGAGRTHRARAQPPAPAPPARLPTRSEPASSRAPAASGVCTQISSRLIASPFRIHPAACAVRPVPLSMPCGAESAPSIRLLRRPVERPLQQIARQLPLVHSRGRAAS